MHQVLNMNDYFSSALLADKKKTTLPPPTPHKTTAAAATTKTALSRIILASRTSKHCRALPEESTPFSPYNLQKFAANS